MGETKVSKLIALFEGRKELPNNEAKLSQLEAKRNTALEALDDAEIQLPAKLTAYAKAAKDYSNGLRVGCHATTMLDEVMEDFVDRRGRLRAAKIEGDRASSKKWARRVESWTQRLDAAKKRLPVAVTERERLVKVEAMTKAQAKTLDDQLPALKEARNRAEEAYKDVKKRLGHSFVEREWYQVYYAGQDATRRFYELCDASKEVCAAKNRHKKAKSDLDALDDEIDELEQLMISGEVELATAQRSMDGPLAPAEKATRVAKKKEKADAAKAARDEQKQNFAKNRAFVDKAANTLTAASDAVATALDQIDKLADAVAAVEAEILLLTEIPKK